jgi:putative ABC transport system permease protein
MFRNYLAAALGQMARNRLYSVISITGLGIGLATAILLGLAVRNELTYDRFITDYRNTYLAVSLIIPPGRAPQYGARSHVRVAEQLKLQVAGVAATTRLADATLALRTEQFESEEPIYWADPNVFAVLPLPAIAGDLRTALQRPEGVVLSRSVARKFFGRDSPLGAQLEVDGNPMKVTAIIEDLPSNGSQLTSGVFASGLASYSKLSQLDSRAKGGGGGFQLSVRTYVKLASQAQSANLSASMSEVMKSVWPRRPVGMDASLELVRIDKVHVFEGLNAGVSTRVAAAALVGILILLLACVNFVNLLTARSSRRAMEVVIRKVSGASRASLIVQFLGESFIQIGIATCIAMAITELSLPYVNAFLNTGAVFDYWRDPRLLITVAGGAVLLATLAGIYPAFVLSAFRPAAILNRSSTNDLGSGLVRRGLVIFQFAILIGLMIAASIVYGQQRYATKGAMPIDTDQVLLVETRCNSTLKAELQRLGSVRAVACAGSSFLTGAGFDDLPLRDGSALTVTQGPIGAGLLELYGLRPLAGRFFSGARGDDIVTGAAVAADGKTAGGEGGGKQLPQWVVNETAIQQLGFESPQAAIGQSIGAFGEIIGVVRDFAINSVDRKINPTIYAVEPDAFDLMHVKLGGSNLQETLSAIDRLVAQIGTTSVKRYFLADYIEDRYRSLLREAQVYAAFAGVAMLLACLGLFGLSASTTERRTKEIGIRKAMGAGTGDIVRLLLWQFSKPVLWANLIAWPIAAHLMSRWLNGFAYHVELQPSMFLLSSFLASAIALATVAGHCYVIARSKPVAALRMG